MNKPRMGLFGGTFDPVHAGHVAVARRAIAHGLDRIVVVPARLSPHKLPDSGADQPAPAEHRWRMLEIAFADAANVELSRMEIDRPGPSYTADTIGALRARAPGTGLTLLLGADQLDALPRWIRFSEWAPGITFLVFSRPGSPLRAPSTELRGLEIRTIDDLAVDASATDVRRRLAAGESVASLLDPGVEAYIRAHGLYGASPRP